MAPFTKIHRNLVFATIQTLEEIFVNQRYADKAIEKTLLSNRKWGARDRAFIAENTYEIVRWWRLIAELGDVQEISTPALWKVFGIWWAYNGHTLPDWEEFKTIRIDTLRARYEKVKDIRKIKEAIPDWIDETGMAELGAQWPTELAALNIPADVVLRANTLKTTRTHLQKLLHKEGVETHAPENYPDALVLLKRKNIFATDAFKNGLLEVQDGSSQLVAPALEVEPGMRVVDACAGAGGKTLHLAALMKNKGTIIAMDTEAWKLENLKKRAARAGITIIQTRLIDSSKTIKRLYQSADRLLLDVPCSGLGVLRRNPDAKWKLKPEFVENIKKTQIEILEQYAPIVHQDGKLVYSTCSILPSENSGQIEKFVQAHPFKLVREQAVLPSVSGFDGFYISLLQPR